MSDKILYQGPGYTIAQTDVAGTLVPYFPADRADGNTNYGWLDLRGAPELVDEIQEATKSEGLRDLLRVIADPASKIMSGACDCGAFDNREKNPDMPWHVGGFVVIMFLDAEINKDPQNLINLAGSLLNGAQPTTEHHIGFEMIIEPLKLFFGRTDCYAIMVKPHGYGRDEGMAWRAFDAAAMALANGIRKKRAEQAKKTS